MQTYPPLGFSTRATTGRYKDTQGVSEVTGKGQVPGDSLSDTEFKTLVIRMLIVYSNKIKKIQAEMKVILSEIKKNLQGTSNGGDEDNNQINILERKEEKKHSTRTARRKKN